MPGDESGIVGVLRKKGGSPAHDVRSDDVCDRIHQLLVADDIAEPRERQMRFYTKFLLKLFSGLTLGSRIDFEDALRLLRREDVNRK